MAENSRAQAQAQAQALEGRSLFPASDDDLLSKEIEKLHKLDGQSTVDVGGLFRVIENVIRRTTRTLEGYFRGDEERGELNEDAELTLESLGQSTKELSAIIGKIHSEITSGLARGIDNHSITMEVLNIVSRFPWDVKAVLPMAAFALIYEGLCILLQTQDTKPLAKSVALIWGLPGAGVDVRVIYKLRFEVVYNLINEMLETTRCIVQVEELPAEYVPDEDPDLKVARKLFPNAVYAVIRSVVAVASHVSASTRKRDEYVSATEKWEISNLVSRLKTMSDQFRPIPTAKHKLKAEKMEDDEYERLRMFIYETEHADNITVLEMFIPEAHRIRVTYRDPLLWLLGIQGVSRQSELEALMSPGERKHLLLLISGLDAAQEWLTLFARVHDLKLEKPRALEYAIVWIPVVDRWTNALKDEFDRLRSPRIINLNFYTSKYPESISKGAIKLFREEWHYCGKPIVVAINPKGRVVRNDAFYMITIWGIDAFPFTTEREAHLWAKETWNLHLLAGSILLLQVSLLKSHHDQHQQIEQKGEYNIWYGGDNLKWIRELTTRAKNIARDLKVSLEMCYMGKSHYGEMVRKVSEVVSNEQLSNSICGDSFDVWYFWTRLECVVHSMMQVQKKDDTLYHTNIILQGIRRLLSFDKGDEGWVLLAKGSEIVIIAHGWLALAVLEEYQKWKALAKDKGLKAAFLAHYHQVYNEECICTQIEFPLIASLPVYHSLCPECQRPMQELEVTFKCRHDH